MMISMRLLKTAAGVAAGLLLLVWAGQQSRVSAESGTGMEGLGANATEITASRMSYSHKTTTVVFSGHVKVVRSDFRLWCQKLTVHLRREAARSLDSGGQESTPQGQSRDLSEQFEKIVAEEDVRLEMNEREARGRKAVYESAANTLTLQGDVVLQEGQNRIQGERVTFYIGENKTEIAGGERDQVKALFFPSKDGESGDDIPSGFQSE